MLESLYAMKRNGRFFRELLEKSLFLDRQWIDTVFPVRFAGLLYSHSKYTDTIQAMHHINKGINENKEKLLKIQVVPHIMYVGQNKNKHFTKLMALECDKDEVEEISKRIHGLFMEIPNQQMEANIGKMRLMPLRADNMTEEETVAKLVKLQQNFLQTIDVIHLFKIKKLDWILPNLSTRFSSHLLEVEHKRDKSLLIRSIEKVEDCDKVILIVERKKRNTSRDG